MPDVKVTYDVMMLSAEALVWASTSKPERKTVERASLCSGHQLIDSNPPLRQACRYTVSSSAKAAAQTSW